MGASVGLATGLGIGIGYGTLTEYARLGLLTVKWKLLPRGFKQDMLARTLQAIIDAEKDKVSGLSTKGAVDVIHDFLDSTINLAWAIDESMASQMFVQMIQQSIAYAIHSSHAGSIGTIANVYSGSGSLSPLRAQTIQEACNEFDRRTRAFFNASLGMNLPTTAFEVVRGANAHLDEYLRRVITDSESVIGEWNDLLMNYYRRYTTLAHTRYDNAITMKEDVVTRAYSLLEQVGMEHLKRINELVDTLDGAYNWYTAEFLAYEELSEIALRTELERQASEKVYDEYKSVITGSINDALVNWDSKITTAFNDLTDMETEWKALIVKVLSPIINDCLVLVNALLENVDKAIEDVCAYRNISSPLIVKIKTEYKHGRAFYGVEYVFQRSDVFPYHLYYNTIGGVKSKVDESESDFMSYAGTQRKMVKTKLGRIYVVYLKFDGGYDQIFVKYTDDVGLTWSSAVKLSTVDGMGSYDQSVPSIAVDSDDNLHVVWGGRSATYPINFQIWYTKYDGLWSTPVRISTASGMADYEQLYPSIAVDGKDNLQVVWYGKASGFTTNDQIWHVMYIGTWSYPIRVSTCIDMENFDQYAPCITVDFNDDLHVVWQGYYTGYPTIEQIWYSKYHINWSTPLRISTHSKNSLGVNCLPCISVDSKNKLHVVWYGYWSEDGGIIYQIWYALYNGSWQTPIRISTADGMDSYVQYEPTIAVDTNDVIHVIWEGKATGYIDNPKLWHTQYVISWSVPTCIETEGYNRFANLRWSSRP